MRLLLVLLTLSACSNPCLKQGEVAKIISIAPVDGNNNSLTAVTIMTPNRRVRVCAVRTWVAKNLKVGYAIDQTLANDTILLGD